MTTPTSQPSKVSTEDEVRPADEHVVTDDRDFFGVTSKTDDEGKPAASSDKPDQTTEKPAASDDNQQQPQGRDRPAERRIKRLTKQLARMEGERTQDRQEIERLTGELNSAKAAAIKQDPEPQFKDFDSPQEYAKAFSKWETGQAAATSSSTDTGTRQPPAPRDPQPAAASDSAADKPDEEIVAFHERGKSKLGDEFQEAIQLRGTAVDNDMGEFMLDSEYGPEIYVHLANNQEESRKIFDSGAVRKVKLLEELEAKAKKGELDAGGEGLRPAADTKPGDTKPADSKETKPGPGNGVQTKAGDPPSDTREAGTTNLKPDPENESMDEYAARRNKEEMAKRGIYK